MAVCPASPDGASGRLCAPLRYTSAPMQPQSDQSAADLALIQRALAWHEAGHGVALASVVSTWGSAPCPAGSQLVVRDDMRFEGSVSGGCVETAVIREAQEFIPRAEPPRLLTFGVSDEQAFDVGLACGGTVEVMLQRLHGGGGAGDLDPDLLREVLDRLRERSPSLLATHITTGEVVLHNPLAIAPAAPDTLPAAVLDAARSDRSGRHGEFFLKVFNPRLRLIVVGAVHVAQHLVAIAQRCNYEAVVVDPREAFLRGRFDGVQALSHWPDAALQTLGLDARTAVVTLTHDPKFDDPALDAALGSEAFYIGALGSRRTQAKRRERLGVRGHTSEQIDRISGPVGLDIGARNPAEIALSIMAEITATLRKPSAPTADIAPSATTQENKTP